MEVARSPAVGWVASAFAFRGRWRLRPRVLQGQDLLRRDGEGSDKKLGISTIQETAIHSRIETSEVGEPGSLARSGLDLMQSFSSPVIDQALVPREGTRC